MDRYTPRQRSELMGRIGAKDTQPEISVRRAAHALGYRFRLHRRDLPGTPDLAFISRKLAVFVHGCFWHQHPGCRKARLPVTRRDFWEGKLSRNVERDRVAIERLEAIGWRAAVIWECETHNPEGLKDRLQRLLDRENSRDDRS